MALQAKLENKMTLHVCPLLFSLLPLFTRMHHCPHADAYSFTKAKIHSLPLSLLSSSFFSIKVTPRASLSGPSYCLVINSCSKPVLAPCDTTANIGITFLITFLSQKCHARRACVLTVGLHHLNVTISFISSKSE